jgi:hypothetical protein
MRRLILLLLLTSSGCVPQSTTTTTPSSGPLRFSGTVSATDGTHIGAPISGADLAIVDGANLNVSVRSDADGHYRFDNLESGRFTVKIAASGFATATPVVDLYRDTEANFVLAAH